MKRLVAGIVLGIFLVMGSRGSYAGSVSDYGQLTGTPAAGTVTYIAYRTAAGFAEILTEDGYNSALGTDQGYQNGYWLLGVENFSTYNNGDEIKILFTGIQAESGKSGAISFAWDNSTTSTGHGTVNFEASTNPAIPEGLSASVISPGNIKLNWTAVSGVTYRVFRSSQASGAGNGHSNGRYQQLAADITPPYTDSSAPETGVWYILVAEDASGNLSGHTDEVYADASLPVELESFMAVPVENAVLITWKTASEVNNLGFNLLRAETTPSDFHKVNAKLIRGNGNSIGEKSYRYRDTTVQPEQKYYYELEQIDLAGNKKIIGPFFVENNSKMASIPSSFGLSQNFPNPFNPTTTIHYQLPQSTNVTITVFDLLGKKITTLVNRKLAAGNYSIVWNGKNERGRRLASGVYFYKMVAGQYIAIKKLILLR